MSSSIVSSWCIRFTMLLSIHMPIWSWSILHEYSFNNNFYNSQQNKAYVYSPINEQHGVMLIIIVIIMYQYSHILFVSLIASTNTLKVNGLSVQLCGIWCESPPGELKTNWMCQLARFSSLLYRRMHEYSVHIALPKSGRGYLVIDNLSYTANRQLKERYWTFIQEEMIL